MQNSCCSWKDNQSKCRKTVTQIDWASRKAKRESTEEWTNTNLDLNSDWIWRAERDEEHLEREREYKGCRSMKHWIEQVLSFTLLKDLTLKHKCRELFWPLFSGFKFSTFFPSSFFFFFFCPLSYSIKFKFIIKNFVSY